MIVSLRTASFRNLADATIATPGKDVFLVGENGQGKTNVLEAVYFCAYASSFRGAPDRALPRWGSGCCAVEAQFSGIPQEGSLVKYMGNRKLMCVDGKRIEDRRELLTVSPCIVFCHEDMEFVAGSPERRRWFFDQSRSLGDPVYLDDLRAYRKVLKIRNGILREQREGMARGIGPVLDALDAQLGAYGLRLMAQRAEHTATFSPLVRLLSADVSGTAVTVVYAPSWQLGSDPIAALNARRAIDCRAGTTLTGPHRDRYVFCPDAGAPATVEEKEQNRGTVLKEFATDASTGQRRLLALLLRAAQARYFSTAARRLPVLLLDDVLLELDPEKRRRFLAVLPAYEQAFYTFLPGEPVERYRTADTVLYHVDGGRLAVA